jgi:hypothetical protein
MAIRRIAYRPSATTLAASTTYTWTENDIDTRGLRALHFAVNRGSSVGGDFFGATGIETIRVKAAAGTVFEASYKHYRALLKRLSYAQKDTFDGASRVLTLPFYFPDGQNQAEQDASGFMPGGKLTLEVVTGTAVANSPTLHIGWTTSDQEQKFFPMFIQYFLNIGVSAGATLYNLRQAGILRGVTLPTQGLSEAVLKQRGNELWMVKGHNVATEASMVDAVEQLESGSHAFGEHHFLRVDSGLPMPPGDSSLRITTGSAWQTTQPDNSVGVYSLLPVGASALS